MLTIDNYPAEWFKAHSSTPELQTLNQNMLRIREDFIAKFHPSVLASWQGREILYNMFLNDGTNKNNLCHELEMNPDIKQFGGIGGGSSYKYGLFFHAKTSKWTTGSPLKSRTLTEQEAIELAITIRDYLIEGAAIIQNSGDLSSLQDYENLYAQVSHIPYINSVWFLKYYQMLFPEKLPVFYGQEIQTGVIQFIKEKPSKFPFIRMGQINLFVKKCGIASWIFGNLYYPIATENSKAGVSDSLENNVTNEMKYWLFAPGADACYWEEFYDKGIMALAWSKLGDLRAFQNKESVRIKIKEMYNSNSSNSNSALANWQFLSEIKPGDIVFVKRGRNQILGRGTVTSDYEYVPELKDTPHCRKINWKNKGIWQWSENLPMKTLTDITPYTDMVNRLNLLFSDAEDSEEDEKEVEYESYTGDDFLDQVFMNPEDYQRIVSLIKKKKNIILQGAPGVGKTFVAKRLAYSIMGQKDTSRVMMVQFHQSYSYEDFIMGYRPVNNGFQLKKGAFYNFCKEAEKEPDKDFFFIIDEINRGNLSKIFGELFMLIEADKRGMELQLLYSDEKFVVPKNVYLIGMMNTADRSLAMLDYALRRRFAFVEMKPGFDTDGFQNYQESLDNEKFNRLISCVKNLNGRIAADDSLGEGFCIGHSYFCNLSTEEWDDQDLSSIVEYELIPLLKEYWFDEPAKVKEWSNNLRSAIK